MPRVLLLSNARSGSTFLAELLNCHPECNIGEEFLNDEEEIEGDALEYIENMLVKQPETFVGFKLFPEQIFERCLRLDDLVRYIGATHIIVLWRESILDALVSFKIAESTNIWYSTHKCSKIETTEISAEEIEQTKQHRESQWNKIGEQWSPNVTPIFLQYEQLIHDTDKWVRYIFSRLSADIPKGIVFRSAAQRQNPAKPWQKISNWAEIPENLRNVTLDVQDILSKRIDFALPECIIKDVAPDREPSMPVGGWRYRVADPFMPTQLKQNVFDAVSSGSISSAGFWPRMLTRKLKEIFQVPVAQPCSNGFTALLLALQTVNIGKEDEVIMPSMTMVAVANSVAFLGARPVFVDSTFSNYNPGWAEIRNSITEKTKAVILTHTYGVPNPDMQEITNKCKVRGLWLIEDISECVGIKDKLPDGTEKLLGTFGDFACASMYVNKMIHAGDGGFVLAKEPNFGSRLASLVNHGFTPSYHFVHFEVATNSKINGLGAAMACGCIDEIETVLNHRKTIADMYRKYLKSLPVILMPKCGSQDTPWVFGIECENKRQKTELRKYLAENGIETRNYFFPLHLQPTFKDSSAVSQMPNAEKFGSTGLYLPTHTNLDIEDMEYISSVIQNFFSPDKENLLSPAPMMKPKVAIQIKPDSFKAEVRHYDQSGNMTHYDCRGHVLIEAVILGLEAEKCLISEIWDDKNLILSNINSLINKGKAQGINNFEGCFQPYVQYFQSQMDLEQSAYQTKPWLQINLGFPEYLLAKNIPTTTEPELLKMLIWLVRETKPETIWEIGCWFGHSTYLMASAGEESKFRQRIFACDGFKWQNWMRKYTTSINPLPVGASFKDLFLRHTEKFQDVIEAVDWPYDIEKLPEVLSNQKPSLVFLDITQDEAEIELIWQMIRPNLIPNETILVFNGLAITSISFFTRNCHQLVPILKPNTKAKVFRYVEKCENQYSQSAPTENQIELKISTEKKLMFISEPAWEHHHKNLFCKSIGLLHKEFHDDNAEILFIPAVEETMCNKPEVFTQKPWIGIIHSVTQFKELFYTPDLEKLCSLYHSRQMKQCRGLFTLTKFQAKYLRRNLPKEFSFPIQSLKYPTETIFHSMSSIVPKLWTANATIDLILIGSFARNFDLFFKQVIPSNLRKVLLVGDSMGKDAAERAPVDVFIQNRLSEDEYEEALRKSIIFLTLKYDGAANTLILECIARNLPIVAPNLESCMEYLGKDYPLLYDHSGPDLQKIITLENIEKAITYLESMDKSIFHPDKFIEAVRSGAVMLSLPPSSNKTSSILNASLITNFPKYDVTICICSYKRTHHLLHILESLWHKQDFEGTFQIIIWNNNDCRDGTVRNICKSFIQNSTHKKSLELINSTTNYYCSIRFSMPPLMKSEYLLICDDDIIPCENFICFFMSAKDRYPNDILCLRGHKFFPHQLNDENPGEVWNEYENLKFLGDDSPESLIHFVHADACLIPKRGLQEVASVEMPDSSFSLVDDYWMSFVLNHKFGRKLRKLCTSGIKVPPIERTLDSETIGLALHTRPEVHDARIRLYIHHMLQGWPSWPKEVPKTTEYDMEQLKMIKLVVWDTFFIGYNISSRINENGISDLAKLGVSCVRIGAVGVGRNADFELSGFISMSVDETENQLLELSKTVDLLSKENISVVLTLDRRIASITVWKTIASHFVNNPFLVGYDVINEPFTPKEEEICSFEVITTNDPGIESTEKRLLEVIKAIREVDKATPIIIEPTYWAHKDALEKLPMDSLLQEDSNLIASFHFYEPTVLTQRVRNKKRFGFPGRVPVYDNIKHSETIYWDAELITEKFQCALTWAQKHSVKIFLGEFGICRDIQGADEYLKATLKACKDLNMIGFLFSFRDPDWDAMDYELGTSLSDVPLTPNWDDSLMKIIADAFVKDT